MKRIVSFLTLTLFLFSQTASTEAGSYLEKSHLRTPAAVSAADGGKENAPVVGSLLQALTGRGVPAEHTVARDGANKVFPMSDPMSFTGWKRVALERIPRSPDDVAQILDVFNVRYILDDWPLTEKQAGQAGVVPTLKKGNLITVGPTTRPLLETGIATDRSSQHSGFGDMYGTIYDSDGTIKSKFQNLMVFERPGAHYRVAIVPDAYVLPTDDERNVPFKMKGKYKFEKPFEPIVPIDTPTRAKAADKAIKELETRGTQEVILLVSDSTGDLKEVRHKVDTKAKRDEFRKALLGEGVIPVRKKLSQTLLTSTPNVPYFVAPDPYTLMVDPLDSKRKRMMFISEVVTEEGKPFKNDPRYRMREFLQKLWQEHQQIPVVGLEPEWFLITRDAEGNPHPTDRNFYYDRFQDHPIEVQIILLEALEALSQVGIQVINTTSEVAGSQHEWVVEAKFPPKEADYSTLIGKKLPFQYLPALRTLDDFMLYKYILQENAARFGKEVTFEAKPFAGVNGSGMHHHLSFWKANRRGKLTNLFSNPQNVLELSPIGRSAAEGVMRAGREMFIFTNQDPGDMFRQVAGFEAPVFTGFFSEENRASPIRRPKTTSVSGARFEYRVPAPQANMYISAGAILSAAHQGMVQKLKMRPEVGDRNLYHMSEGELREYLPAGETDITVAKVPGTFREAIQLAALSEATNGTIAQLQNEGFLTKEFVSNYLRAKQEEAAMSVREPYPFPAAADGGAKEVFTVLEEHQVTGPVSVRDALGDYFVDSHYFIRDQLGRIEGLEPDRSLKYREAGSETAEWKDIDVDGQLQEGKFVLAVVDPVTARDGGVKDEGEKKPGLDEDVVVPRTMMVSELIKTLFGHIERPAAGFSLMRVSDRRYLRIWDTVKEGDVVRLSAAEDVGGPRYEREGEPPHGTVYSDDGGAKAAIAAAAAIAILTNPAGAFTYIPHGIFTRYFTVEMNTEIYREASELALGLPSAVVRDVAKKPLEGSVEEQAITVSDRIRDAFPSGEIPLTLEEMEVVVETVKRYLLDAGNGNHLLPVYFAPTADQGTRVVFVLVTPEVYYLTLIDPNRDPQSAYAHVARLVVLGIQEAERSAQDGGTKVPVSVAAQRILDEVDFSDILKRLEEGTVDVGTLEKDYQQIVGAVKEAFGVSQSPPEIQEALQLLGNRVRAAGRELASVPRVDVPTEGFASAVRRLHAELQHLTLAERPPRGDWEGARDGEAKEVFTVMQSHPVTGPISVENLLYRHFDSHYFVLGEGEWIEVKWMRTGFSLKYREAGSETAEWKDIDVHGQLPEGEFTLAIGRVTAQDGGKARQWTDVVGLVMSNRNLGTATYTLMSQRVTPPIQLRWRPDGTGLLSIRMSSNWADPNQLLETIIGVIEQESSAIPAHTRNAPRFAEGLAQLRKTLEEWRSDTAAQDGDAKEAFTVVEKHRLSGLIPVRDMLNRYFISVPYGSGMSPGHSLMYREVGTKEWNNIGVNGQLPDGDFELAVVKHVTAKDGGVQEVAPTMEDLLQFLRGAKNFPGIDQAHVSFLHPEDIYTFPIKGRKNHPVKVKITGGLETLFGMPSTITFYLSTELRDQDPIVVLREIVKGIRGQRWLKKILLTKLGAMAQARGIVPAQHGVSREPVTVVAKRILDKVDFSGMLERLEEGSVDVATLEQRYQEIVEAVQRAFGESESPPEIREALMLLSNQVRAVRREWVSVPRVEVPLSGVASAVRQLHSELQHLARGDEPSARGDWEGARDGEAKEVFTVMEERHVAGPTDVHLILTQFFNEDYFTWRGGTIQSLDYMRPNYSLRYRAAGEETAEWNEIDVNGQLPEGEFILAVGRVTAQDGGKARQWTDVVGLVMSNRNLGTATYTLMSQRVTPPIQLRWRPDGTGLLSIRMSSNWADPNQLLGTIIGVIEQESSAIPAHTRNAPRFAEGLAQLRKTLEEWRSDTAAQDGEGRQKDEKASSYLARTDMKEYMRLQGIVTRIFDKLAEIDPKYNQYVADFPRRLFPGDEILDILAELSVGDIYKGRAARKLTNLKIGKLTVVLANFAVKEVSGGKTVAQDGSAKEAAQNILKNVDFSDILELLEEGTDAETLKEFYEVIAEAVAVEWAFEGETPTGIQVAFQLLYNEVLQTVSWLRDDPGANVPLKEVASAVRQLHAELLHLARGDEPPARGDWEGARDGGKATVLTMLADEVASLRTPLSSAVLQSGQVGTIAVYEGALGNLTIARQIQLIAAQLKASGAKIGFSLISTSGDSEQKIIRDVLKDSDGVVDLRGAFQTTIMGSDALDVTIPSTVRMALQDRGLPLLEVIATEEMIRAYQAAEVKLYATLVSRNPLEDEAGIANGADAVLQMVELLGLPKENLEAIRKLGGKAFTVSIQSVSADLEEFEEFYRANRGV